MKEDYINIPFSNEIKLSENYWSYGILGDYDL